MSKFNLSEKRRKCFDKGFELVFQFGYNEEDVKEFIARLRTRLNEVEFSTIDEIRNSQINCIIKRLAGDKLT